MEPTTEALNVRTIVHMLSDLLEIVDNEQWSGQHNTSCNCHPEYVDCCPQCGVTKYNCETRRNNKHATDCTRIKLMEEVRAFIDKENLDE